MGISQSPSHDLAWRNHEEARDWEHGFIDVHWTTWPVFLVWLETWPETCWNMLKHVETCWNSYLLTYEAASKQGSRGDRFSAPSAPGDPDGLHCPDGQSPNFSPWKSPFFSMENQLEGLGHEVSIATLMLLCRRTEDLTSKDRIDIQMWVEYEQNENQRCALLVVSPEFIVSIPFLKRKNGSPTGMMICVYLCGQMWSM